MSRSGVSEWMPEELKPYLTYSVGAHVLAAAVALRVIAGVAMKPAEVYTIDFVGPSATIQSRQQAEVDKSATTASPSISEKPAPDSEFDEFGRRTKHKFVLPRPSLLKGFQAQEEKQQPQEQTASRPRETAPAAGASAPEGGGGPSSGVQTDMPNFPYPWYISQVRAALWNRWAGRMPREAGQCVVVFSILQNGQVVDMRAEESSGSSAFDLTAMSAVQDAGPFAPLPKEFKEPFLKIHVTLKSQ